MSVSSSLQVYIDGMPTMSSQDRKATLREFYGTYSCKCPFNQIQVPHFPCYTVMYIGTHLILMLIFNWKILAAVVYPSLQQLEGFVNVSVQDNNSRTQFPEALGIKAIEGNRDLSGTNNVERDDECGICMECCTKIVLPDCGHSMCNRCFHEW